MRTIDTALGQPVAPTRGAAAPPWPDDASSSYDRTDLGRGPAIALLALAVVVAAALRFVGGGDQLWFDEIATLVSSVREPLTVIMTHFPSDNDHVFYSVLAHISVALGGETPLMVRLPAILLGIASIPLIYAMGTKITTRFEALAGAILATAAAYHVWFSQNARGYTLLLVLTLVGTQMILDGLKTRSRKPWLIFAVVSALGAYTHLSMVLAVLGQAIAVSLYLFTARRLTLEELKGPAIGFIGAAALTVMLYLPMFGDVAGFFSAQATTPKAGSAGSAGSGILHLLGSMQLGFVRSALLIIGGAVFLVGVVSFWRQSPLIPLLFFIPPSIVCFTTVLLGRPTRPRFFFFIAGFLVLVGVRGVFVIIRFVLDRAGQPWTAYERPMRWVAVAGLTGFLLVDLSRTYGRPKMDYVGALAYVDASRHPSDIIALAGIGTDYVYNRFYGRNWPRLTGADHLASLRRRHDVLVLHTFEGPLSQGDPNLLEALKTRCVEERSFAGTLQDGDIHVSRCTRQP
jgi:4-amino-4-deoxy-L-arabinose transferase-like glycosyltransferase